MRTRRSSSSSNPVLSVGEKGIHSLDGKHRTVLLHESVESLGIRPGDTVVDATLGGAGHALAVAKKLDAGGTFIGVDADTDAIARTRDVLANTPPRTLLIEGNFRDLRRILEERGISAIDKVLFDLGWSAYQLTAGRGFSFRADEPLHMGYSAKQELTAETIVNDWAESSLVEILRGFGEERDARRIARAIVEARAKGRIVQATALARIIEEALPRKHRKVHPATKTFQALRIAVNDELGALEEGLAAAWSILRPSGRIAVISFHSLEDRIVKRRFLEWEQTGEGRRLAKKPIVPSERELHENPRARSAKLRVIEKRTEHTV